MMTQTDSLRASRDGDQFHYHWAARQALRLLQPATELTAIVIEGVSTEDTEDTAGEEVVDLTEYWGSTDLSSASKIIYRQLKHSTVNANQQQTSSYLKKTLVGFASKYRSIIQEHPHAVSRVSFEFISVSPVAQTVKDALDDITFHRQDPLSPKAAEHIRRWLADILGPAQLASFLSQFLIHDNEPGLLHLRSELRTEMLSFLPGAAATHDLFLREMVSTRASSIAGIDPVINRATVLATLQTTEEQLLPAPNLIDTPEKVFPIPQVADIAQLLVGASAPVLTHATGGMGKSVLASTVGDYLPEGSATLVYDCFGRGTYRRLSSSRHEHRRALLQMSNELAAQGLCGPVLPSETADARAYMRVFLDRLATAARALTEQSPEAVLLLVIDAADNAVMAAGDVGAEAFVPDLMAETLPPGARLLILCRTERRGLLRGTPTCIDVPWRGFDQEHSTAHLVSRFGDASRTDGVDFHHLTQGNPRVQSLVMQGALDVQAVLRSLGETQHGGTAQFAQLMAQKLDVLRAELGNATDELARLCLAMAALRPRIPVGVLAEIAKVEPAFILSFASEFGRSIVIDQDTLQFRDEPSETWFRSTFRPDRDALLTLIDHVRPLAESHPYLSATLPQLLFEAGMVRELVDLALSAEGLAAATEVDRQEIAHQRAQFALKAALRDGREHDAARLAWTAGNLHAGKTRRVALIRGNADLAGEFLDEQSVDSLLATRDLVGEWPGSHLHVEGALLAARGEMPQARSRLRSAETWMRQWVRQSIARDDDHKVSVDDIAGLALGILTASGSTACVGFIRAWSPPWVAYAVGRKVADRLIDRNETAKLEELAIAAARTERLQLAIVSTACEAGIILAPAAVRRTLRMLKKHNKPIKLSDDYYEGRALASSRAESLLAIALAVGLGTRHDLIDAAQANKILQRYLPETLHRDAGSRFDQGVGTRADLFAFTLNSALQRQVVDVESIAHPDISSSLQERGSHRTRASSDFAASVIPLTRWMRLFVESTTQGRADHESLLAQLDTLRSEDFRRYGDYEPPRLLINSIARLAARLLSQLPAGPDRIDAFGRWLTGNFRHLTWPTVVDVVRVSSRCEDMQQLTVDMAGQLGDELAAADAPAEERYETLVSLARATYAFDPAESRVHFAKALELTARLGEDVYDRWDVVGRVAQHACDSLDQPARAYRLAQVAESLQSYLGDDSNAAMTVLPQIQRLSAQSGLAIASRWRDRRVAPTDQICRVSVNGKGAPLDSHPSWALGMLPLGAGGSEIHLKALGQPGDAVRADAEAAISEWLKPFELSESASRTQALNVSGAASLATVDKHGPATDDSTPTDAFADVKFTTSADWDAAVKKLSDLGGARSRSLRRALLEYAAALPPKALRIMLETAANSSLLQPYDYDLLLERLAARPTRLPAAASEAVGGLVDRLVERFSKRMVTSRYEVVNLSTVQLLCGRSPGKIVEATLHQLGTVPEMLNANECYQLTARLTGRIGASASAVVLDHALESFSGIAPIDGSDGLFEDLPVPVPDAASRVAAFVWCAAGDPAKQTRWNAAHTVRLWVALGSADLVEALIGCANGDVNVSSFIGSGLVFYDKHALMWTLMALARASHDEQSLTVLTRVPSLVPLLRRIAFDDPPHAVLQHSAGAVLRRLHDIDAATLTPSEVDQLTAVNCPAVLEEEQYDGRFDAPPVRLDGHALREEVALAGHAIQRSRTVREGTRFSFPMDFGEHWCTQLGRAFGFSSQGILQLVDETIVDKWSSPFRGQIVDDRRYGMKLYADGGTYLHKSTWPAEDDLDFYLSLHALYEVAGHLARQYAAYKSPGDEQDDYTRWLGNHLPSRNDGRWVFDRRDPVPPDLTDTNRLASSRSAGAGPTGWLNDVPVARFRQLLLSGDGGDWLTTDGHWTETTWDSHEAVTIRSVLVHEGVARALLAALQTAPDLHSIGLPEASDRGDRLADRPEHYRVVHFADDVYLPEGIDTEDPNAAGISWPPTRPAESVTAALELIADADMRNWLNARGRQVTTAVWSTGSEHRYQGHRMQVHLPALRELLVGQRSALALSVRISRNLDTRYHVPEEEEQTAVAHDPHLRFFLLRAQGGNVEIID